MPLTSGIIGTLSIANGGTGLTAAGTNGQVLTSTESGTLAWATPSTSSSTTYAIGLNTDLGGYVFFLSSDSKHGLVAETIDQVVNECSWYEAQNIISAQASHSTNGKKFTDWRLPTNKELKLLYDKRTVVGGFRNSSYWSSTEDENDMAWFHLFYDGYQGSTYKSYPAFVRAIRTF